MTSMHKQFRVLIGALFILALLSGDSVYGAPSANIIHVRHDAIGSNDGSSWADAFTDLQYALGIAEAGHEIWVAQGVYHPAPDASDRTATFELQDGVALYGGFAGTETQRDQRDWEANLTVLSGDLDRNDGTDSHGVVTDTVNITGTNAYHVVTGDGVAETAVLDGFTITAGTAEGSWPDDVGGGMYNSNSNPTLTNVTFTGNRAEWSGGGMSSLDSNPTLTNVIFSGNQAHSGAGMSNFDSNPTLTNVTFTGNQARWSGGGMLNSNSNPTLSGVTFTGNGAEWSGGGMSSFSSDPALTNGTFSRNQADRGGAMYNSRSNPTLTNLTFTGNRAKWSGGGMYNSSSNPTLTNVTLTGNLAERWGGGMSNLASDPMLVNVTFSGNQADSGGGVYNNDSCPTLVNCILWGNTPDSIVDVAGSGPAVTYSAVEGGYPGQGNIDVDPRFVDPVSAAEAPTTAGNHRLTSTSPAIDAGTNDVLTVDIDLDGNPRVVDGTGDGNAVVDMGAYEFQTPLLTVSKEGEGLVTSAPAGIDCGSICAAGFPTGTVVSLTTTADPGWTFTQWSGDCTGTDICQVTMDDDRSLTAHFSQNEYTLDVHIVGQGGVDAEPEQDSYFYGDVVTLTATTELDWTFVDWSGDVNSVENPLHLTMDSDKTLTATFQLKTYVITPTFGAGGVVTPSVPQTVSPGDDITFTIAASFGYHIDDVAVDGISLGAISSYTFINVVSNHTISATFAQGGPPQFVSADHTAFFAGQEDTFIVEATGVPTPTIALTGVLPSGVTFTDNGDGTAVLSGTPTVSSAGVYPLVFTARNNVAPDGTQAFTLTVKARVYLPLVLANH